MLGNNVGPGIDQSDCCLFFSSGIIPGIGPEDFDLHVGIDALRTQSEGVDAADDFRDRESSHIADDIGFCFLTGNDACDVTGFVHTAEVVAYVGSRFETGAVQESNVGIFFGDVDRRVHIAKAGGKDHFVALGSQLSDDAFRIGTLGNGFDVTGLNVGHVFFDILTAQFVCHGIAAVFGRADVNESDFGFVTCCLGIGLFVAAAAGE